MMFWKREEGTGNRLHPLSLVFLLNRGDFVGTKLQLVKNINSLFAVYEWVNLHFLKIYGITLLLLFH
jgi:hypothetical protein